MESSIKLICRRGAGCPEGTSREPATDHRAGGRIPGIVAYGYCGTFQQPGNAEHLHAHRAGPDVETSQEVIVVEGRADVMNMLRQGIKNVIGMQGTKFPKTIATLSKTKEITLFVDGDRGGKLISKNVTSNADVNYIAVAPDGKEVEELTGKEILVALRRKIDIDDYLKREIAQCKRSQAIFSYALLDLDHFKDVNDRYGHAAGDRVLRSLAAILTNRLRNIDIVGRYGGEEISLILPGTDARQAVRIMEEILTTFRNFKHQWRDQFFSLTFSAGIAEYPGYKDIAAIQDAADKALYRAKDAGRNQVKVAGV